MNGIIFDLDGTLCDSMESWYGVAGRVLAEMGVQAERAECKKLFTFTYEGAAQWLGERYGVQCDGGRLRRRIEGEMEDEYFNKLTLKADAAELLQELKARNVPITLATATGRRLAEALLKRTGVLQNFRGIFTCEEAGAGKRESPAVYLMAAKALNAQPGQLWVFEDSPHAARTAKEAGFCVAGVFGRENRQTLPQYCDVCFESLSPAEEVLSSISGKCSK